MANPTPEEPSKGTSNSTDKNSARSNDLNNTGKEASKFVNGNDGPEYVFILINPKEHYYIKERIRFIFKVKYGRDNSLSKNIRKDLEEASYGGGLDSSLPYLAFKLLNLDTGAVIELKDKNPTRKNVGFQQTEVIWSVGPDELAEGTYQAFVEHNLEKDTQTNERIPDRVLMTPEVFDVVPNEAVEPAKEEPLKVKLDDAPVKFTLNEPVKLQETTLNVSLNKARQFKSADQLLWILIRNRTIKFETFNKFIDSVMGDEKDPRDSLLKGQKYLYANRLSFNNVASYSLLKFATEKYLMQECGLVPPGLLGDDAKWKAFIRLIDADQGRTGRTPIEMDKLKDEFLNRLLVDHSLPYLDNIRDKLKVIKPKEPYEIAINFLEPDDAGTIGLHEDTINIDATYGILPNKLLSPCMLELIWSYWHEEGGLVQTMNAISRRFQNIRNGYGKDPLANFNLDPLRPLNNLLWGYIEDERNRLSMSRRNLEYQYEYGISLIGKAVPQIGVVEHRTNFIRAFHNLLKAALEFYNQANFTAVIPDAFPLLNHLREVHLILAEGAHNQYGDLPWTSRVEMLIQQWLLSRTEMREFLGGRIMVPYNEPWMDKVDSMKTLQGWYDTNITHFHDLGVFGEQLLLSIRYGNWNSTTRVDDQNAANWAHYWRNEVQRYVHAYNAVTGVDLSADVTDARVQLTTAEDRYTPPAILIQKQAALQKSRQQYALQSNGLQPALPQSRQVSSIQPIVQKKLNG